MLGFAGLVGSLTTVQLCRFSVTVAADSAEISGCSGVLIKFYLQKEEVGQVWPSGWSLPTLYLSDLPRPGSPPCTSGRSIQYLRPGRLTSLVRCNFIGAYYVMVNCMGHLDWVMGCPGICKHYSGLVCEGVSG